MKWQFRYCVHVKSLGSLLMCFCCFAARTRLCMYLQILAPYRTSCHMHIWIWTIQFKNSCRVNSRQAALWSVYAYLDWYWVSEEFFKFSCLQFSLLCENKQQKRKWTFSSLCGKKRQFSNIIIDCNNTVTNSMK